MTEKSNPVGTSSTYKWLALQSSEVATDSLNSLCLQTKGAQSILKLNIFMRERIVRTILRFPKRVKNVSYVVS
jgi:hypothetical protein